MISLSKEFEHGRSAYTNHGCRCEICTEKATAAHTEYMKRRPEQRFKHRMRNRLGRGMTIDRALEMEAAYVKVNQ